MLVQNDKERKEKHCCDPCHWWNSLWNLMHLWAGVGRGTRLMLPAPCCAFQGQWEARDQPHLSSAVGSHLALQAYPHFPHPGAPAQPGEASKPFFSLGMSMKKPSSTMLSTRALSNTSQADSLDKGGVWVYIQWGLHRRIGGGGN